MRINNFISQNEWIHITIVRELSGNISVYKNSILDSSKVLGKPKNTTENVKIGASSDGQFFNGSIDDVRIYNRALSADEIKNLYEQRDEIHDPFVYKTV